jgi:hypothetical protein
VADLLAHIHQFAVVFTHNARRTQARPPGDLARATGQELHVNDATLDRVDQFFELLAEQIFADAGPFGPAARPSQGATRLERVVARTGREPSWNAGR